MKSFFSSVYKKKSSEDMSGSRKFELAAANAANGTSGASLNSGETKNNESAASLTAKETKEGEGVAGPSGEGDENIVVQNKNAGKEIKFKKNKKMSLYVKKHYGKYVNETGRFKVR